MRYLAIDYGNKRTGLAICDPDETIASPLGVLEGRKDLARRVAQIARREQADAFVVGLPLNMDGTEGHQAKLVRQFASELCKCSDISVCFQDERLSSFGAEEKLDAAGYSRKRKAGRIDAVAAAEILSAFMEARRTHGSSHPPAPDSPPDQRTY